MSLPSCTANTTVITNIGTDPDERGLTTDQFKAKFDEAPTNIKTWIDETYSPAIETEIATAVEGIVIPESQNYTLPTTNLGYAGETSTEAMAADGSVGDVVYIGSTGYDKAQAADDTKIPCVALRLEVGTGNKKILRRGFFKNTAWSFTKGQLLWLSTTTAGAITNTKPTTTGNRVQCLGYAVAADTIYFYPSTVWLEV